MPLAHVASEPVMRQVFGRYSASYFGMVILWWAFCGWLFGMLRLPDTARRKTLIFKAIMLGFSVGVSLLVLELFLHARPGLVPLSVRSRLAAGGAFLDFRGVPGSYEVPGVRYPFSPNQADLMTESVSNLLGAIRSVKSGKHTDGQVFSRTSDHQGFCNPVSETGKVDCLFIGDSFTEISHLPWEQRWPTLVASKMGWTMRNLGKGGISPMEAVKILEHFGAPHQPKLVIFSIFEGNDPWDSDCWEAWQASGLSYTRFLVQRERFVNRLILFKWYEDLASRLAAWRPGKAAVAPAPSMTYLPPFVDRLAIPPSEMREFRGWRSVEGAVAEAKAWCDQHASRLVVLHWPSKEHVYAVQCEKSGDTAMCRELTRREAPAEASARLALLAQNANTINTLLGAFCQEVGVPCYSVLEPVQAAVQRDQAPYYLDDIHPNQEGNRVVVDPLTTVLKKLQ